MALTSKECKRLALDIIKYLQKNELFYDVLLYLNDSRYSSNASENAEKQHTPYGEYYIEDNIIVSDYVKYNNPETVTMTFEGPLNHELNFGDGKIAEDLNKIAKKYNLYFEQGYSWSLAFYPI